MDTKTFLSEVSRQVLIGYILKMELGRDLNTKVMYTFNVGKNDIHVPRVHMNF